MLYPWVESAEIIKFQHSVFLHCMCVEDLSCESEVIALGEHVNQAIQNEVVLPDTVLDDETMYLSCLL